MKKHTAHTPIYTQNNGGLNIQTGFTSEFTQQDSTSYLTIKQHGLDLLDQYQRNGLLVNSKSYLKKLVEDASVLSDAWLCNDLSQVPMTHLFSMLQLERIATAALPLGVSVQAKKYLGELLDGSLDLLSRSNSKAKNTLWELELWQLLIKLGMHATLEEPDIVVSFDGARIGVACKKIYSEKNVSKVLSNAVSQFENTFDFGIVAFNLDDLIPAHNILKTTTIEEMAKKISDHNFSFLNRHEQYLRRYLSPGRAISGFISTSVIAEVATAETRFLNSRQSTIWNIPGLTQAKEKQILNFFNALNAAHT